MPPNALATALQCYLDEVADHPGAWSWARNNCCHFAGRWVLRATGTDCLRGLADVPGPCAARQVVVQLGAGGLRGAVSQRMGCAPLAGALAQVGDVVLLRSGDAGGLAPSAAGPRGLGFALGLCAGRSVACLGADGSVRHLPLGAALAAWPLPGRGREALRAAA